MSNGQIALNSLPGPPSLGRDSLVDEDDSDAALDGVHLNDPSPGVIPLFLFEHHVAGAYLELILKQILQQLSPLHLTLLDFFRQNLPKINILKS